MYVRNFALLREIVFQMLARIFLVIGCATALTWPILARMAKIDTLGHAQTPKYTWRSMSSMHPARTVRSGRCVRKCVKTGQTGKNWPRVSKLAKSVKTANVLLV